MKIAVNKEFKNLIFPLTQQEKDILERSILKYGVKDKLVVWDNGRNVLVDGHHRWEIIQKHQIRKYEIQKLKFKHKSEVVNWIIENQMGRRNCTPGAISYLRGLRYKNEKGSHGGDRIATSGHSAHLKTSKRLATFYNVDEKTIRRDEKFYEAINSIEDAYPTPKTKAEIKNRILTGQISHSKRLAGDILSARKANKRCY
ncbi:hypothetical protein SMSP2_01106 [Limihaloglobus sulfuriphilus]|uniref:ParB/Sulfiredoxin domain-containing protein n=1 Tax=Limihaloglobus sulfuriphilus TaxID=1851148 RepID=A0A1Q2MDI2_9BACT|nr:ParB N-terminal domain-containing protein [Limihaloglobus sulfuriphilus]AQQ70745.1 hypothetical protein SMSP2_01106 [Limihaloglobus sulfuriphilus]